jgi:HD-GYP domain-containing protein (c-di-GMP phosphodiesterase class II)
MALVRAPYPKRSSGDAAAEPGATESAAPSAIAAPARKAPRIVPPARIGAGNTTLLLKLGSRLPFSRSVPEKWEPRVSNVEDLRLSELVAAFSYALDITEGQPAGHCVRSCWIGMHVGRALGLSEQVLWEAYFTLLLKDLGCSSNAARICELYLTDDLKFKRDFKWVDGSFPQIVQFALKNTALGAGLVTKIRTILGSLETKDEVARELIVTRCSRGADIARRLRFGEPVADGIFNLDEHWDGKGNPAQLAGEDIPLHSRLALLAQVVDVFEGSEGIEAALAEVQHRRGTWFDPRLVDTLLSLGASHPMWAMLHSPDLDAAVAALAPASATVRVDEDYLDEIAAAFGQVVDSKSPYTSGHSERVALYTDLIAKELGLSPERRRWLHRGALLHDVGKLGVSNSILDKPGKLDEAEWAEIRKHPVFTEEILARVPHFAELAVDAAAHHERLDGKGYPRGITAEHISLETRIITTADIFDAITAERPYRGATLPRDALAMMAASVGTALDPSCFAALCSVVTALEAEAPVRAAA